MRTMPDCSADRGRKRKKESSIPNMNRRPYFSQVPIPLNPEFSTAVASRFDGTHALMRKIDGRCRSRLGHSGEQCRIIYLSLPALQRFNSRRAIAMGNIFLPSGRDMRRICQSPWQQIWHSAHAVPILAEDGQSLLNSNIAFVSDLRSNKNSANY